MVEVVGHPQDKFSKTVFISHVKKKKRLKKTKTQSSNSFIRKTFPLIITKH